MSVNPQRPVLDIAFQDSLTPRRGFSGALQLVYSYFHIGINAKTKTKNLQPATLLMYVNIGFDKSQSSFTNIPDDSNNSYLLLNIYVLYTLCPQGSHELAR